MESCCEGNIVEYLNELGMVEDQECIGMDNKGGVRAFMVDDLRIVDGKDNILGTMQIGKKIKFVLLDEEFELPLLWISEDSIFFLR